MLMEEFQHVHKTYLATKSEGNNAQEIRQDIKMMEDEKEQLTRRVEKLKKKIEPLKNKQQLMENAKNLRQELDREAQQTQQRQELRNFVCFIS